jgi:hypothetical protein
VSVLLRLQHSPTADWLESVCVCVNCEAHLWGLVEAGTPTVLPLPVPRFFGQFIRKLRRWGNNLNSILNKGTEMGFCMKTGEIHIFYFSYYEHREKKCLHR